MDGRSAASCVVDRFGWGDEVRITAVSDFVLNLGIVFTLCSFTGIQASISVVSFCIVILDSDICNGDIQSRGEYAE